MTGPPDRNSTRSPRASGDAAVAAFGWTTSERADAEESAAVKNKTSAIAADLRFIAFDIEQLHRERSFRAVLASDLASPAKSCLACEHSSFTCDNPGTNEKSGLIGTNHHGGLSTVAGDTP